MSGARFYKQDQKDQKDQKDDKPSIMELTVYLKVSPEIKDDMKDIDAAFNAIDDMRANLELQKAFEREWLTKKFDKAIYSLNRREMLCGTYKYAKKIFDNLVLTKVPNLIIKSGGMGVMDGTVASLLTDGDNLLMLDAKIMDKGVEVTHRFFITQNENDLLSLKASTKNKAATAIDMREFLERRKKFIDNLRDCYLDNKLVHKPPKKLAK